MEPLLTRPRVRRSTIAAWVVLFVVVAAAALAWWLPRRSSLPATPSSKAPTPTPVPTRTASRLPAPTVTVTRTVAPAPSSAAPASRTPWTGTVVSVSDGDTLDVLVGKVKVRVRLLDVDAPETAHGSPAQCGAQKSKVALRTLALGKSVRVVPDSVGEVTERFGRALAYVELVGPPATDLGAAQLRAGMAEAWHPKTSATPSRDAAYRKLAAAAKRKLVGNWASCATQGR